MRRIKAGLAVETRYVSWGAAFPDLDNDGLPDIFIVTGNVYPDTERALPAYPYRTPPLLYRNLGNGRFEELGAEAAGPALAERHSSRGMALADLDNDGDVDVVVWNRNEPPGRAAERSKIDASLAGGAAGGDAVEPGGDRRDGDRGDGRPAAGAGGPEPDELPFGVGSAAALRIGRGAVGGCHGAVADGRAGAVRDPRRWIGQCGWWRVRVWRRDRGGESRGS